MVEVLSIISTVSFVISGICFVIAVFCWFRFKIPSVIGDLSGRTARKSIAQLRAQNEKSANRIKREDSGITRKNKKSEQRQTPETDLLVENETEMLVEEQTELLVDEQTALLVDEPMTELLVEETIPLQSKVPVDKRIELLEEILLIHTNEVIG